MDMFDDAFGSAPAATTPQADPAADFINREQADLGDLGMEFGLSPDVGTGAPLQEQDGTNSFLEPVSGGDVMSGLGDMGGLGMPEPATSAASTVMPDLSSSALAEPSGMPDFGGMSQAADMPDMGAMMSTPAPSGMPDLAGSGVGDMASSGMPSFSSENIISDTPAVGAADPMEKGGPFESSRLGPRGSGEEPECLRKWREEQKERIRIKDEEEERKKEELRQKAKKELESFYKNYEEELQLTKKENRIAEEAFLEDVHGLKPGTEWERVCRNSNFNSKVNHNKKDRSRMRNVLLTLKQTPLMNREEKN